jgi:hypothetical protein
MHAISIRIADTRIGVFFIRFTKYLPDYVLDVQQRARKNLSKKMLVRLKKELF